MAESKRVNLIFKDAPHAGKNENVLVAEVDDDAHPGHPLPEPPPVVGIPEFPTQLPCVPGFPCWGQDLVPTQPACFPGMPCWEPPPVTQPPDEPLVIPATVSQVPPGVTPPAAPSANVKIAILDLGPDAKSALGSRKLWIWIEPPTAEHLPAK